MQTICWDFQKTKKNFFCEIFFYWKTISAILFFVLVYSIFILEIRSQPSIRTKLWLKQSCPSSERRTSSWSKWRKSTTNWRNLCQQQSLRLKSNLHVSQKSLKILRNQQKLEKLFPHLFHSDLQVGEKRLTDAMGKSQLKLYEIIFKITFALVGIALYFTCRYIGIFVNFTFNTIQNFIKEFELTDEHGQFSLKVSLKKMTAKSASLIPVLIILLIIYGIGLVILMATRLMLIEIPLKYLPSIIQWFLFLSHNFKLFLFSFPDEINKMTSWNLEI